MQTTNGIYQTLFEISQGNLTTYERVTNDFVKLVESVRPLEVNDKEPEPNHMDHHSAAAGSVQGH